MQRDESLARCALGNAHYDRGDYDAAIVEQTKAITLDPSNVTAYNNRGNAHYRKRQYEAAKADYARAMALDPNDGSSFNNRGAVYFVENNLDAAMADYTKAIELNSSHCWRAYYNRREVHEHKGDDAAALADCLSALVMRPYPRKDELLLLAPLFSRISPSHIFNAIESHPQGIKLVQDAMDERTYLGGKFLQSKAAKYFDFGTDWQAHLQLLHKRLLVDDMVPADILHRSSVAAGDVAGPSGERRDTVEQKRVFHPFNNELFKPRPVIDPYAVLHEEVAQAAIRAEREELELRGVGAKMIR